MPDTAGKEHDPVADAKAKSKDENLDNLTFAELYERLTPYQRRFIDEMLAGAPSYAEALRKAGYKGKRADASAHEMASKPLVKAALAAARREALERAEVTADRVIKGLFDEATRFGPGSSHSARVQAWTQLGKYFGLFPTKISGKLQHAHTFEDALEEVLGEDGDGDDAGDGVDIDDLLGGAGGAEEAEP